MRLPVQTIHSFQHSCLEDTDRIWSFMENKTSEELRSSHSIHILESLRNTLLFQFGRMSSAGCNHNPGDGNVNTNVLARLDKIVESTRLEVDHVLRTSGDKFSHRVLWRPDRPIHSIQYLPRSIYLSRTVSPQGDAICPPRLATC